MVMLLKNPGFTPAVSRISTALLVLAPFLIVQFLIVSLTIGVVPIDPSATTLGDVALVFSIVRLRSVPPLFEPSIVTKLAPFSLMIEPLALAPVRVAVTPAAGLIV